MCQFESVLTPLQKCSLSLQSDDPGANSGSVLAIYLTLYEI